MRTFTRIAFATAVVLGASVPATTAAAAGVPCYFACYECVTEPCCQPVPPGYQAVAQTLDELLPGDDPCA